MEEKRLGWFLGMFNVMRREETETVGMVMEI